ncbi:MAG TPA: hypothetical protein VFM02_01975 [Candidatus Paceibacterota bacterium]|nr:hypothetical protein [Candidatus Paceibacterota bacterium]
MGETSVAKTWRREIGSPEDGFFHHAYLLEGENEMLLSGLKAFLQETFGVTIQGNPDFHEWNGERFALSDLASVREQVNMKSVADAEDQTGKMFVLSMQSMTLEAQNAFLKMIEEPTAETVFFFVAPSREIFLPTILSRLLLLRAERETELSDEDQNFYETFFRASRKDRLQMLEDIIKEKDKVGAALFLNRLEIFLRKEIFTKEKSRDAVRIFEEIRKARGYLRTTAPSVKMLLEHIALSL